MVRDDDSPEAFEDEPTHLDEMKALGDRQTRTYKTAETALRVELVRAGCTEDEIKHIVARVRAGAGSPK